MKSVLCLLGTNASVYNKMVHVFVKCVMIIVIILFERFCTRLDV